MAKAKPRGTPGGFINMPVTQETREGIHQLKELMGASSQAEVIAKLVAMGIAIHNSVRSIR